MQVAASPLAPHKCSTCSRRSVQTRPRPRSSHDSSSVMPERGWHVRRWPPRSVLPVLAWRPASRCSYLFLRRPSYVRVSRRTGGSTARVASVSHVREHAKGALHQKKFNHILLRTPFLSSLLAFFTTRNNPTYVAQPTRDGRPAHARK